MGTFVVTPDGTARAKGMRRVGRVLPVYATEDGEAARKAGYRFVSVGVVDDCYCPLYARIGLGWLVSRRVYWMRHRAPNAWRAVRNAVVWRWGAVVRWWRRQIGYAEWEA